MPTKHRSELLSSLAGFQVEGHEDLIAFALVAVFVVSVAVCLLTVSDRRRSFSLCHLFVVTALVAVALWAATAFIWLATH